MSTESETIKCPSCNEMYEHDWYFNFRPGSHWRWTIMKLYPCSIWPNGLDNFIQIEYFIDLDNRVLFVHDCRIIIVQQNVRYAHIAVRSVKCNTIQQHMFHPLLCVHKMMCSYQIDLIYIYISSKSFFLFKTNFSYMLSEF